VCVSSKDKKKRNPSIVNKKKNTKRGHNRLKGMQPMDRGGIEYFFFFATKK
jgi:hypothetical protein